jgi:alkanesulfonate monooxygenase SsuD/methylene tetrahydromethanopterin reductase-like flavin-dependent oxidoreductase (luciferase family)
MCIRIVDFGVAIFPTLEVQDPAELARMAEQRGFESLMFPEHTHIPASRETPYASDGAELPREYTRHYDPFVAVAAAAAVTERIRIGTAVCLVIQRDPIITAQEVASVDRLSGGRFVFGVGAGWNAEEMRNHGTDLAQRFGVMRDRVEAIAYGDGWIPWDNEGETSPAGSPSFSAPLRRRAAPGYR